MKNQVKVRLGDIFDEPGDLIVLPCSTFGNVTTFVAQYLQKFDIPMPRSGLPLGYVDIQPLRKIGDITQFIAFAVSVDDNIGSSTPEAIEKIGERIGQFTLAESSVRMIAIPLLGAGAGKLFSEIVISNLRKGFLAKAHPQAILVVNILHKNVFDRVVENLQEIVKEDAHTVKSSTDTRALQAFLCHSSADKLIVREIYSRLCSNGVNPWLDEESLLPGQDWQQEIRKAVRRSDVVIVCLSQKAVTTSGFVQKEIKYAIDIAEEQPEDSIFLIPLKIEDCNVPDRLSRWHWVNYFEEQGYAKLIRTLQFRAKELEIDIPGQLLNNNFQYGNKQHYHFNDMALPHVLQQKIIEFLMSLPNIDDSNTQRALIYSSGLDEELQHQIQFVSSTTQFFQLLVPTLNKYGKLRDGRNALETLLVSAKKYVGQEKGEYCDKIINELYSG